MLSLHRSPPRQLLLAGLLSLPRHSPRRLPAAAPLSAPLLASIRPYAVRMVAAAAAPASDEPLLPEPPAAAVDGGTLAALAACGKRGRWRTALELLAMLEARPEPTPAAAYRSALLALRKHERHEEAMALLERMGEAADTHACNEVLHLLRLRSDYAAADALWRRMRSGALGSLTAPDALSFYHVLHICGEAGRWAEAMSLLDELHHTLGGAAVNSGHYLAAMKACSRDRRWHEAVALVRTIPAPTLAADAWLCRLALSAAAEAAEPALARSLLASLGAKASVEQYAACLMASRRAADLGHSQQVWAALEASHHAPDELCYALMVGALFDAAAAAKAIGTAAEVAAAEALVVEAMDLTKLAAAVLPNASAPVVITAALGLAIGAQHPAASRAALSTLHAIDPSCVDAAVQLKVLEVCVAQAAWSAAAAEALAACDRQIAIGDRTHLAAGLDATVAKAEAAAASAPHTAAATAAAADEAAVALSALRQLRASMQASAALASERRFEAETAEDDVDVGECEDKDECAADEASRARRDAQKRYSRSIVMPAEAAGGASLDVVYEDEDLLAVAKPIGIPVQPRHRFEARSMVNRAIGYLGGRTPYTLHRLDAPTSGLLLFAKSVLAARDVQRQFRTRLTRKTYLAVLLGVPEQDTFIVDAPIAFDPLDRTRSVVVAEPPPEHPSAQAFLAARLRREPSSPTMAAALLGLQGKASLTEFGVVGRSDRAAACIVRPLTGRMHQIRVHADLIGHPLAGDTQYGVQLQPTSPRCERLLLHAHALQIRHPTRQQLVTFTAAPPPEFMQGAEVLGLPRLAELAPSGVVWGGATLHEEDEERAESANEFFRERERRVRKR